MKHTAVYFVVDFLGWEGDLCSANYMENIAFLAHLLETISSKLLIFWIVRLAYMLYLTNNIELVQHSAFVCFCDFGYYNSVLSSFNFNLDHV